LAPTVDENEGILFDETLRGGEAYPAVSARDHCDFSVKSFCSQFKSSHIYDVLF
jgi:hypothetical protein